MVRESSFGYWHEILETKTTQTTLVCFKGKSGNILYEAIARVQPKVEHKTLLITSVRSISIYPRYQRAMNRLLGHSVKKQD